MARANGAFMASNIAASIVAAKETAVKQAAAALGSWRASMLEALNVAERGHDGIAIEMASASRLVASHLSRHQRRAHR